MFCSKCGNQSNDGAAFCQKCGEKFIVDNSAQQTVVAPSTTGTTNIVDSDNFKLFVDDHVKKTTKYQTADELLTKSKPTKLLWICFGIIVLFFTIILFPIGILIGIIFGYALMFIAGAIIRNKCRNKFSGTITGDIDIEDFIKYLDVHLKYIHPDFHEWGHLTKAGLLAVVESVEVKAKGLIRLCAEFGPKKKRLVELNIKTYISDEGLTKTAYRPYAEYNGFMLDARASHSIAHGTLIKTAPILQAAIEYYQKQKSRHE